MDAKSLLTEAACPNCAGQGMNSFYRVSRVPVHSVLLFPTREKALGYPRGDIDLACCPACGFISNVRFDPNVHEYSTDYEETQGFSATFRRFHEDLALRLIQRHDLRNKEIIEIGCGKGEFLTMLCELGGNRGLGFDPAYVDERNTSPVKERITFINDFYSEKYSYCNADFVCCKMTLEHIPDTFRFMQTVRRSIGDRAGTTVFFMIPEMRRILRERAFWDIYYEHCSYFTPGSLARLFRRSGFEVLALGTEYDGQYLTIEAKVGESKRAPALLQEESIDDLIREVISFADAIDFTERAWKEKLQEYRAGGKRVVIWGGGSKGVTFLTKLGVTEQIPYAVDVNPFRHGTFLAGTGQEIVSPDFLREYRPDVVIVMNPIYMQEIGADLQRMNLHAALIPITGDGSGSPS